MKMLASLMKHAGQFICGLVRLGLVLWIYLLPFACLGQFTTNGTLYTIQSSGSVSNRLNVVFLSEGYTAADLAGHFLSDVTNAAANLFTYQPYQDYRNYCNIYAIAVPSTNSGATHPYYQQTNKTFFASSYDAYYDYIITIPAAGLKKMTNLLASLMPQTGLPVILVNDVIDGGGGGAVAVISRGPWQREILAHETGHTLGRLQDEYDYGYPDLNLSISTSAANTSQTTNQAAIPWSAWITNGTPIPTPATAQYAGTVGVFAGANYHPAGWYRPQEDCMMRSLGTPFCAVCLEHLIKAIYLKAHAVESYHPATNGIIGITNSSPLAFALVELHPLAHDLTTQWFINGVADAGATNETYTFDPGRFTNGSYTVQAVVHDPTAWVKTDPSNLLGGTLKWKLAVNISGLSLDRPRWAASNKIYFRVHGTAPHGFVIECSTNLSFWLPLETNQLTGGQCYVTNNTSDSSCRFYRARIVP